MPSEACAFWRVSPSVRVLSVTGNPALLLSLRGRKANAAFVRRDRWEWRPFSAGRECQKLGSKSRTTLLSHMEKRGSNKIVIAGINNSCPAFE